MAGNLARLMKEEDLFEEDTMPSDCKLWRFDK
jgi:hypothetical protein